LGSASHRWPTGRLGAARHPVIVGAAIILFLIATPILAPVNATITQGDFSIYGTLSTRWSGRWGEGGSKDNGTPTTFFGGNAVPGTAATESGGSFDFSRWDLVQARQVADIRPDYHLVKNHRLLGGRLDVPFLADADLFGVYRGWADVLPELKDRGRAEANRDWTSYNAQERNAEFRRNDLREYYAQLNFTPNFAMRIGKQQIIWSEADALSGTDVTNPSDLRFHWTHFEAPEDLRRNIRAIKFDYIVPDFLKTSNNELQGFVIPGDYEGAAQVVNISDARSPYVFYGPESAGTDFNQEGQPFRDQTFADAGAAPMIAVPTGCAVCSFADFNVVTREERPSSSLTKSEFGVRYSTLLPIGNGLQANFIYLYEARSPKLGVCITCTAPPGFTRQSPGIFLSTTQFAFGPPRFPFVPKIGTVDLILRQEDVRQHYLVSSGTYYDKALTNGVFRWDFLYAPKYGVAFAGNGNRSIAPNSSSTRWTQQTRFILAGDRPTYVKWISKQHVFFTFQNVLTWYPDRPSNAVNYFGNFAGKLRETNDLFFLAATNWLLDGKLTSTDVGTWDVDDQVGYLGSTNTLRYSKNVLLALNAIWYLGRSGRYTDPFIFSRDQRINEIEVRASYEL
jgi:hypothetical protein